MPVDTERLILWIGVHKSPGDTQSAEQGAKSLPFITPAGEPGLKMSLPDAWQPREPGLKNSGVWADGALQDGRTLLSDNVENVIEVITLQSTDSDFQTLVQRMAGIRRTIKEARQFTSTIYQIEPCYIEWSALGGFGSQYALVYNIDVNVEYVYPGAGQSMAVVTLTLEREPYWRGLPPGAHPRQWTFESRGLIAGKDWNWEDFNQMDSSIASLVEGINQNRNEYSLATDDYDYPSVSQNWVDIDESLIPGDAPALCMITMGGGSDTDAITFSGILASKISKPLERTARNGGGVRGRPLTINAADTSFDNLTETTDGMVKASTGTRRVIQTTGGGATNNILFPDPNIGLISANMLSGRYLVFARAASSGGAIAAGEVEYSLRVSVVASANLATFNNVPCVAMTSGSTGLTLLGTLQIPADFGRAQVNLSGGLLVEDNALMQSKYGANAPLRFILDVDNNSANAHNLIDLCFVPIDESAIQIKSGGTLASLLSTTAGVIMDNSGYYSHGLPSQVAYAFREFSSTKVIVRQLEMQGTEITLTPKKDNRISFLCISTGTPLNEFDVRVDIIPRWIGVRDA